MTPADIIRDPPDADGVSVVIASNDAGRVEPFLFEHRKDAERFADDVQTAANINIALVYHGIPVLDAHAAQRVEFGVRRLKSVTD